ncbi:MAG: thymidylate synthase [Phycisphaerae bacterium]|nr:thymidylate synthase [Phycisphaerae bacterium]
MTTGNIPTLFIEAQCLPEAWEKTVLAVWKKGIDVKTEYDKPEDPPSKDATVMIAVENPFAEPRIHKNFPGGPEELESYRQEVCDGIHDHWIDPVAGKWTYTYHERMFAYNPTDDLSNPNANKPFKPFDQINYIVEKCAETFHTRRAQAITWMPTADPATNDPPCLQRLWFRILKDDQGQPILNMNSHWRSRDLYKAWFMNCYALTELQRIIAQRISEKIGQTVKVGRYVDITDSLHIYGSYFNDAMTEIEKMQDGNYKARSWDSNHPAFQMMTDEAKQKLTQDPDWYAKGKG